MAKTEYEYLIFTQLPSKGITSRWDCRNKKSNTILGQVTWYSSWRQYCYFPTVQAVYSTGCLNDISQFIKQLMNERNNNG